MRTFVTAVFRAKPGHADELERVLTALVEPTMGDKGCVSYALNRSQDDRDRLVFMEEWESREDLEAHLKTDHVSEGLEKAGPLLADQDIIILERVAGGHAAG